MSQKCGIGLVIILVATRVMLGGVSAVRYSGFACVVVTSIVTVKFFEGTTCSSSDIGLAVNIKVFHYHCCIRSAPFPLNALIQDPRVGDWPSNITANLVVDVIC